MVGNQLAHGDIAALSEERVWQVDGELLVLARRLQARMVKRPLGLAVEVTLMRRLPARDASDVVAACVPASLPARVRLHLARSLSDGHATLAAVAHAFGLRERQLQQRLARDGTSFSVLRLQARQDVVKHLLRDGVADSAQIARCAGYGSAESFRRVFRSWSGTTPEDWRRRNGRPAVALRS